MQKDKFFTYSLTIVMLSALLNIVGSLVCSAKTKNIVGLEKNISLVEGDVLVQKAKQAEQYSLNQLVDQANLFGFSEPSLVVYASSNKKVAEVR